MNTFISAVLVGLVGVFCMWDSRLLGRLNFEQPLVGATLVGLLLGDVPTGLAVGAAVELVSMGLVQVGAAVPPDMVLGGIVAAAFACLTDASAETAMTIAIPVAVLGQLLGIVFRSIIAVLTHVADNAIDNGKFKTAYRIHICAAPVCTPSCTSCRSSSPSLLAPTWFRPSSTWFPSGCPLS